MQARVTPDNHCVPELCGMQKVGRWEEKEEIFWVSSVSVTKSF